MLGKDGYVKIMERCRNEGITVPVVAIGGILADDVPEILAAGVAGIAMSGALLNAPSPAGETKRILQLIERKQLI